MRYILTLFIYVATVFSQDDLRTQKRQNSIVENLKMLENTYINTLNFEERRKAIKIMNRILKQLGEYKYDNDYQKNQRPYNAMSDAVFHNFLLQLKNESYSSKINLLRETIKFGVISSAQASQILKQFEGYHDPLELFKICFNRIYDKVNISVAINSVHWAYKDKVLEYLESYEENKR